EDGSDDNTRPPFRHAARWLLMTAAHDGIPDERERAPSLTAMLRAEAEEDDAPLPQRNLCERDLARQIFLAEQPARTQHVAVGVARDDADALARSEEHTSELQSLAYLVCRLLLEKKKKNQSLLLHETIS